MSKRKIETTTHWLVTVGVLIEGKRKTIGRAVQEFPVGYDKKHVKLSCLASAINIGMIKHVQVGTITAKKLGEFIQENLLISVKPLTRCKRWKRYSGKRKPQCCDYCAVLFSINGGKKK